VFRRQREIYGILRALNKADRLHAVLCNQTKQRVFWKLTKKIQTSQGREHLLFWWVRLPHLTGHNAPGHFSVRLPNVKRQFRFAGALPQNHTSSVPSKGAICARFGYLLVTASFYNFYSKLVRVIAIHGTPPLAHQKQAPPIGI
jgi:hypothetical protein